MHSLKVRLKLYRSQFDVSATRKNIIFLKKKSTNVFLILPYMDRIIDKNW